MPIQIPELGDDRHEMWLDLIRLAGKRIEWTLVGAHMVALYAWEAGLSARPSNDADVLVNARVVSSAIQEVSRFLLDQGYDLTEVTQFNVGHHFVRRGAEIDVLAPEGLGERADISTIPPARTVQVKGGSQALARTERVRADVAILLSLFDDPEPLARDLTKTEQKWLRRHPYLGDPADPAWDQLGEDERELGATVYRRLSDT